MKKLIFVLLFASLSFAESAKFKKGAFGCKSSDSIKGFWSAYKNGKAETFRYMFQSGCAFLHNGSWKIVDKSYLFNKVCSDDGYCYWVEREFFK